MSDRNVRLDALLSTAKQYVEERKKRINQDLQVAKRVMKGRTGQERLQGTTAQATNDALLREIQDFTKGL